MEKNDGLRSLPTKTLQRKHRFDAAGAFLWPLFVLSFLVFAIEPLTSVAAVYHGVLSTSDPTFNRPSTCSTLATGSSGSAVRYDAIPFTITTPGTVTISFEVTNGGQIVPIGPDSAGPDTFLVLYTGSFNPATPLANCNTVNDDINGAVNRRSRIVTSLAVGSYTVVVTSFKNVPVSEPGDDVLPWTYDLAVLGTPTYGATDFLLSDFTLNKVAVFDQNLVFKHNLDAGITSPHGMDFLPNGNVAVVARGTQQIKIYNPNGVPVGGFTGNPNVPSGTQDMKVSGSNLIYVGTNSSNVSELNMSGTKLRGFGSVGSTYGPIALVPGNKLWASNGSSTIDVFDLSTGSGNNIPPSSSFSVGNNGQVGMYTMTYSASTNTVLMTGTDGDVYERSATNGAFVRKFVMSAIPPGTYTAKSGVTRGPGGNVYVVTHLGGGEHRIARFNGTTGAFIDAANTNAINFQTPTNLIWAGNAPALGAKAKFDFDGDNKTDISIFRPSLGQWWINRSSNGSTFATQFGNSTDKIVPADFTGDGKSDIAFWRPSTGQWFVLRSEDNSFFAFPFGTNGDVPMPADYDGDNKADAAVFRPSNSTWFISRTSDLGTTIDTFGTTGDVPVAADYDGDGRTDEAIFRPSVGQWWLKRSTAGVLAVTFGNSSDKQVQADYTGDGKVDVAFWRPSTGFWFVLRSEDLTFFSFPFGANGDTVAPGDYDGDGRSDAALFRPTENTWYVQRTSAGTLIQPFGATGDRPLPNAFVP